MLALLFGFPALLILGWMFVNLGLGVTLGIVFGLIVAEKFIFRIVWPLLKLAVFRMLLPFVFGMVAGGKFQYLPELEKGLRRASQGFALCAFAVLAVVVPTIWRYGWHGVPAILPWAVNHPEDAWPVFVCAALFATGLIRCMAGVRASAGARDDIKKPTAAVKLAVGVGIIAYLLLVWPVGQIGAFPGGLYAAMAAWSVGLWCALVGGMRFALLTITVKNALSTARGDADRRNAPMRPGKFRNDKH
jgi:hypothetical protein